MAELGFIATHKKALCGMLRAGKGSIWSVSLMVWGGITGGHKTDLVVMQGNLNARRYIGDVLQPRVIPFLQSQ